MFDNKIYAQTYKNIFYGLSNANKGKIMIILYLLYVILSASKIFFFLKNVVEHLKKIFLTTYELIQLRDVYIISVQLLQLLNIVLVYAYVITKYINMRIR